MAINQALKTKKCCECSTRHSYHEGDGISETCWRCTFVLQILHASIESINQFVPFGSEYPKRKLTITGYKIEKV